jgi:uncharacterized PurR-regulated membrane protein YhhQ (DUF165 family)
MNSITSRISTLRTELDTWRSKARGVLSALYQNNAGERFANLMGMAGAFLIIAYMLTIPTANFLIGHVGTVCIENGPCLIPVAPGILAPSGVLMIGMALLLRDLVQRRYGARWSLGCVAAGTALSFLIAPPALALASGLAFFVSELADFAVFTPLYRRRLIAAVILSCLAGAVVDSGLFLWLAFGSLDHLGGQVIGKAYAAIAFAGWRRVTSNIQLNRYS